MEEEHRLRAKREGMMRLEGIMFTILLALVSLLAFTRKAFVSGLIVIFVVVYIFAGHLHMFSCSD